MDGDVSEPADTTPTPVIAPRPQLTLQEVAELEGVLRNGMLVAGELGAKGHFTQAGAVDALMRTIGYLRGKFQQPPRPTPAPSSPPPAAGSETP